MKQKDKATKKKILSQPNAQEARHQSKQLDQVMLNNNPQQHTSTSPHPHVDKGKTLLVELKSPKKRERRDGHLVSPRKQTRNKVQNNVTTAQPVTNSFTPLLQVNGGIEGASPTEDTEDGRVQVVEYPTGEFKENTVEVNVSSPETNSTKDDKFQLAGNVRSQDKCCSAKKTTLGAGGVIRDQYGDLIFAYATPLGHGTNNKAEVEAVIWGLSWCLNNDVQQVIIEVDSELLVRWIRVMKAPPWHIEASITSLLNLFAQFQYCICIHVYREANFVADLLSKISHQSDNLQHYFNYSQLPL
ncbi:uncharacterized protein LOC124889439 [Capsicum annuum]|uniref:uncharacterized protein LOC124889439 n=1 Tax=Capsicum annuum TaxID=4072 RepID=UPI001FB1592F|nr:uncharacterized protein LOC124889439 [Capsicum annuum]